MLTHYIYLTSGGTEISRSSPNVVGTERYVGSVAAWTGAQAAYHVASDWAAGGLPGLHRFGEITYASYPDRTVSGDMSHVNGEATVGPLGCSAFGELYEPVAVSDQCGVYDRGIGGLARQCIVYEHGRARHASLGEEYTISGITYRALDCGWVT